MTSEALVNLISRLSRFTRVVFCSAPVRVVPTSHPDTHMRVESTALECADYQRCAARRLQSARRADRVGCVRNAILRVSNCCASSELFVFKCFLETTRLRANAFSQRSLDFRIAIQTSNLILPKTAAERSPRLTSLIMIIFYKQYSNGLRSGTADAPFEYPVVGRMESKRLFDQTE